MPTRVLTLTETVDGVTYTASTSLPKGARLLDALVETPAEWTATAALDLGDGDAADALISALDVAPFLFSSGDHGGTAWGDANGNGNAYSNSGTGKVYPAGATITAVITAGAPGGPTGLTRVTLLYEFAGLTRAAVVA